MKLAEALSIIAKAPADGKLMPVLLACGFTPLHLQNYLAAHLQRINPARKVRVETGLFGDLTGTLSRFVAAGSGTAVLTLEWADLDPRLGYRQTGGWGQRVMPNILETVKARLEQLEGSIAGLSSSAKLVVSLPTLDLPPAFHTTGQQASEAEMRLLYFLHKFAADIVAHPSVVIINPLRLASVSANSRYDFRSDLNTGFPYTQVHAESLARNLAELVKPSEPKKGLITDLDDTFWHGLVGEIGGAEVSWDLESHSQMHGLYQQMLRALAEQGALVAVASKNTAAVAAEALNRPDLVMDREKMFPMEVHWEAKSGSVDRILKVWNISADAVVFVDDSPLELAEVKAAHPGIECILFPKSDYAAALALLQRLRDLFGKARLSEEDSYRLQSIRQGQEFAARGDSAGAQDLLASAEAVITLQFSTTSDNKRLLELINKTNQFNLNGRRYTEEEWHQSLNVPGSFLLSVAYQDRFGPLGTIAAVKGHQTGEARFIEAWVMSCRAFSRQIEYQTLMRLFQHFKTEELVFDYAETPKNQPLSEFFKKSLLMEVKPGLCLTGKQFRDRCPVLHHEVKFKQ